MSTNCGNCGHGIMEHTVPSHCFREKCYCEKYVIPGPEDKFPYGYPQKALEAKSNCRICPKCNRIFVEYGDPQCPFCLSPVSHPCTPEAYIRAAADKMAEAGWKALILLRDIQRDEKADGRTLTGRFEIIVSDLQATLSEYQKAVGK